VPLELLFFASPGEQQQWLQQALAEGAYGMRVWQRWHIDSECIATRVAHLRTPEGTQKVLWALDDVSVRHRGLEQELDRYVKGLLRAARW